MFFVLDYNRKGALKGALTMDAARLIRDTWGGTASIIEASTLAELKRKCPSYFEAIAELVAAAPVPEPATRVDKTRRARIQERKAALFQQLERDARKRVLYDFRARREANERARLQREFEEREARKREREEAAKAALRAEITHSKLAELLQSTEGE